MNQDVIALFRELVDLSSAERDAYFTERQVPPGLRAEVESLLRFDASPGMSLADRIVAAADSALSDRDGRPAGGRYGAYRVIRLIGRGGMGAVYEAEQDRPRRRVALKVIKAGLAGPEMVRRFERESQALGRLQHPGIAQIYEAGTADTGLGPQPYFAMELVQGQTLLQSVEAHDLTIRQRLELCARICDAVDHAHQRGIIHRDLKPANILVDESGQPKILDFGVARITDSDIGCTRHTDVGQLVGTLAYMSPEQVLADPLELDTRSDVYSLGVILYELLARRLPYTTTQLHEIAQAIRDDDPAPLGTIDRACRGDVETIVAKALAKEKDRRYGSVAALADDIRRHLRDEPIEARPPSTAYQLQKFARRHTTLVAAVSAVIVVLVAGLAGTLTQARRATLQARRAEAERVRADRQARAATDDRDFALAQLSRADAINDLNAFLLSDAAPSGKPFTARDLLGRAEQIVRRQTVSARGSRTELLISIGLQYKRLDEDARARRLLAEAYALARQEPAPATRASAACALASAIVYNGEATRAEALVDEALSALPGDPQFALQRVDCLLDGGEVALERGDANAGIARVESARAQLARSPVRPPGLDLRVSMSLAESYRMAGRSREANAAFAAAAAQLNALGRGETEMAGTLLNNWALALNSLGQPLEAERLFRRAVGIASLDGSDAGVSPMLLTNLARSLSELNRLDEALHYLDRADEKATRAGDENVVTQALMVRAGAYLRRGDFARAADAIARVEARWKRLLPPGHVGFGNLAIVKAAIALGRGDRRAAVALADESIAIAEASSEREYLPLLLTRRSDVLRATGNREQARADAARAVALFVADTDPSAPSSSLGRAYLALGRALADGDRAREASTAFSAALAQLEPTLGPDHPDTQTARRLASIGEP